MSIEIKTVSVELIEGPDISRYKPSREYIDQKLMEYSLFGECFIGVDMAAGPDTNVIPTFDELVAMERAICPAAHALASPHRSVLDAYRYKYPNGTEGIKGLSPVQCARISLIGDGDE